MSATAASSAGQSVAVSITNNFSERVLVQLYHENTTGLNNHGGGWILDANQTQFAFNVTADPLHGNTWWVKYTTWGSTDGRVYTSNGSLGQHFALGTLTTETSVTFQVDVRQFVLKLATGTVTVPMVNAGASQPITNVFVLMLENHSFDNIFGRSMIPGITVAAGNVSPRRHQRAGEVDQDLRRRAGLPRTRASAAEGAEVGLFGSRAALYSASPAPSSITWLSVTSVATSTLQAAVPPGPNLNRSLHCDRRSDLGGET